MYRFGPAYSQEQIVFGAQRPGYPSDLPRSIPNWEVESWLSFMHNHNITRLVCLLPEEQLDYYENSLLDTYIEFFGEDYVIWEPISDFCVASRDALNRIMEFLDKSDHDDQKVVVHCSGGIGRTGHILTAWLIHARGFCLEEAVKVITTGIERRDPYEAVGHICLIDGRQKIVTKEIIDNILRLR